MKRVKQWAGRLLPAAAVGLAAPVAFSWPPWTGILVFGVIFILAELRGDGSPKEPAAPVRRTESVPESFKGLPGRGPSGETPQPAASAEDGMPLPQFLVSLAVLALVLTIGVVLDGFGSLAIQMVGAIVALVAAFFGARIAIDWSRGVRTSRTGSIDEAIWDASDHELDRIRRGPY